MGAFIAVLYKAGLEIKPDEIIILLGPGKFLLPHCVALFTRGLQVDRCMSLPTGPYDPTTQAQGPRIGSPPQCEFLPAKQVENIIPIVPGISFYPVTRPVF